MVDILMAATMGDRPKLTTFRSDLPDGIDEWVAKSLAIDASARYPYVSSMWNDFIRLVMEGGDPSAELARQNFSLPE